MLALRDAPTLSAFYTADALLVCLAFAALAAAAAPLTAIWTAFLAYQLLRLAQFALRVAALAARRPPQQQQQQHPFITVKPSLAF